MDEQKTTKSVIDLSNTVPDLIPYLRPGEHVVSVETPVIVTPERTPDALSVLMQLTGAKTPDEIGENGPPNAATATEENKGVVHLNLFETLFGRDSLIVSSFLLNEFPKISHATILALAARQGTRTYMPSEEEPGKIMHEDRDPNSSIAIELHESHGWEFPYYGTVDATPLFVDLIAAYVAQEGRAILSETYTDRNETTRTVFHAFENALNWIQKNMGSNKEGLLEFCRKNPKGHPIQAWKDSSDSYFHHDGKFANIKKGIASVEVQGYAYDALLCATELYESLGGYEEQVTEFRRAAAQLKETVFSRMWIDDPRGGYFALGTDRDDENNIHALRIRTSNMGHLLSSRLLDGNDPDIITKREALVRMLTSKEMLAASGVRTLSCSEQRFRPGAYHNGSVWLWDSYYVSRGFRKHGFVKEADDLVARLYNVIAKTHVYPEFARGDDGPEPLLNTRIIDLWDERQQRGNRIEQPPQQIQAWTVAAYLAAMYENA